MIRICGLRNRPWIFQSDDFAGLAVLVFIYRISQARSVLIGNQLLLLSFRLVHNWFYSHTTQQVPSVSL